MHTHKSFTPTRLNPSPRFAGPGADVSVESVCIGTTLTIATADCEHAASTLSMMVTAHAAGGFIGCEVTTPTTTPTTTTTTTTTTMTTTPKVPTGDFDADFYCADIGAGVELLAARDTADSTCGTQVKVLDVLLHGCPGAYSSELVCAAEFGFDNLVVDTLESECSSTAAALGSAADAFMGPTFPAGTNVLDCLFGKLFYVTKPEGCAEFAATLNTMVESFQAGGFQECEVTTPTTTTTPTTSTTPTTTTTQTTTTTPTTVTTPTTTANEAGEKCTPVHPLHPA